MYSNKLLILKKNIHQISQNFAGEFDNYSSYEQLDDLRREEIEDSIRSMMESRDYLHGFRFIYPGNSCWGKLVENSKYFIQQEAPKTCLLAMRLYDASSEAKYPRVDDLINFGRLDVKSKERVRRSFSGIIVSGQILHKYAVPRDGGWRPGAPKQETRREVLFQFPLR